MEVELIEIRRFVRVTEFCQRSESEQKVAGIKSTASQGQGPWDQGAEKQLMFVVRRLVIT